MTKPIYHYSFSPEACMRDAKEALLLAAAAAEGLHGRSRLQLEATFRCDPVARMAEIDAGTEVGESLARVYTALLTTTIGEPAFQVERIMKEDQS